MRLLGIVDWTNIDKAGKPIAGVVPLFETDIAKWRPIKAAEEFPTQGQVFWFKADGIKKDELIYFHVEENPGGRDEFKVCDPHVAIEVRDFRKLGSPEVVRLALQSGLKWTGLIPGRSLLWCASDVVVGPMKLVTTPSQLFTFEHAQKHEIPCYASNEVKMVSVTTTPFERYVLAEDSPLVASSYVDWDNDNLVARRALKWAAARVSQENKVTVLTQNQIKEAADYLTRSGGDAKLRLEQYRLKRTLDLFTNNKIADRAAAKAIDELQKLPLIVNELQQLKETVGKATEESVRESLRVEREALESARKERESLQGDIKALQANLKDLRAEKLAAIDELDKEVNKRISDILDKPIEFLADVAVLNTVLQRESYSSRKVRKPVLSPDSVLWRTDVRLIKDFKEFKRTLVKSSRFEGVQPDVLFRIHAASSGKLMPLLAGPRSIRALQAYANVACGGRMFQVHASPSMFEPSDIFGRVDSASRRFFPHRSGLIDIFQVAEKHGTPALLVIEGTNRAPTESYLLPLLSSALAGSPFRLFHPLAVTSDDPYSECFEIQWPANLMLCGTLVEGATTLPISREIWTGAVVIETDKTAESKGEFSDLFEINPSLELDEMPDKQIGACDELFETLPEYSSHVETAEQFLSALSRFEPVKDKLESALIESLLLPLLVSLNNEDLIDAAMGRLIKAASGVKESSEVETLVQRLRRRLT